MLTENYEKLAEELKALKQELEQTKKGVKRQDDYRQIMNVMASHSYGYYGMIQEEEIDEYWSSRDDIIMAHGSVGFFGREGVYGYYVGNTDHAKLDTAAAVKRVYNIDTPEGRAPGYRVMNMLNTPFIEIADDGLTAQGVWMLHVVRAHINNNAEPVPSICEGRACGEFIKENGAWKLWHYRDFADFEVELNFALPFSPGSPELGFPEQVLPFTPEERAKIDDNSKRLVLEGDEGYEPWNATLPEPPMPKPYKKWDDAQSFIKISEDQSRPEPPK